MTEQTFGTYPWVIMTENLDIWRHMTRWGMLQRSLGKTLGSSIHTMTSLPMCPAQICGWSAKAFCVFILCSDWKNSRVWCNLVWPEGLSASWNLSEAALCHCATWHFEPKYGNISSILEQLKLQSSLLRPASKQPLRLWTKLGFHII